MLYLRKAAPLGTAAFTHPSCSLQSFTKQRKFLNKTQTMWTVTQTTPVFLLLCHAPGVHMHSCSINYLLSEFSEYDGYNTDLLDF